MGENFPVMESVGAALVEAGFKSAQPLVGGQARVRKALLSRTRLTPKWDALRKVIFKEVVAQLAKRHGEVEGGSEPSAELGEAAIAALDGWYIPLYGDAAEMAQKRFTEMMEAQAEAHRAERALWVSSQQVIQLDTGKGLGGQGTKRGAGKDCWQWAQGSFWRGDDCSFMHDSRKRGAKETDTRVCHQFKKKGNCVRGEDCRFVHEKKTEVQVDQVE